MLCGCSRQGRQSLSRFRQPHRSPKNCSSVEPLGKRGKRSRVCPSRCHPSSDEFRNQGANPLPSLSLWSTQPPGSRGKCLPAGFRLGGGMPPRARAGSLRFDRLEEISGRRTVKVGGARPRSCQHRLLLADSSRGRVLCPADDRETCKSSERQKVEGVATSPQHRSSTAAAVAPCHPLLSLSPQRSGFNNTWSRKSSESTTVFDCQFGTVWQFPEFDVGSCKSVIWVQFWGQFWTANLAYKKRSHTKIEPFETQKR